MISKPIIYQMLPRLWGNLKSKNIKGGSLEANGTGKFSNIDDATLSYLKDMGFSHVWYTGIIRHATTERTEGCKSSSCDWVKGKAGSPYSITDYYDVNPYLADNPRKRMDEFNELLNRTHQAGLSVIIDFVPNHVARDYKSFSKKKDGLGSTDDTSCHWKHENDFFYYPGQELKLPVEGKYTEMPAMASGNVYSPEPSVNDWYDTIKINYCDTYSPTWEKMYDILRFWCLKGVDGFRCDMVELVPKEFFKWAIARIKAEFPEVIFIAEVYKKNLYEEYVFDVGFDYLYDKSGIYDAIVDIVKKNLNDSDTAVDEWQSVKRLTWNWQSLGRLQPNMLNFLENHDEQRFASDYFGKEGKNSYAALYASLYLNTCAFMLYFGEEIGERGMDEEGMSGLNGRTTIFDWWNPDAIGRLYSYIHGDKKALSKDEKSMLGRYRKALRAASKELAFKKGTMYDLCYCNSSSNGFDINRHFAFLRDFENHTQLVVCNFSAQPAEIDLILPDEAFDWLEMPQSEALNSKKPIHLSIPAMDAITLKLF